MTPNDWKKYPDMDALKKLRRHVVFTMLNTPVIWEPKRDGSNICIRMKDGFLQIFSRNQLAIPDLQTEIKSILKRDGIYDHLLELIGSDGKYWVYGELIRKGKSPAQFEKNPKSELIFFDIWDDEYNRFLPYHIKKNYFECYNIPYLPYFKMAVYNKLSEIEDDVNNMIDVSKNYVELIQSEKIYEKVNYKSDINVNCVHDLDIFPDGSIEGFVVKWQHNNEQFQFKVKCEHKYPRTKRSSPQTPKIDNRPELELSEVMGSIDKVYNEIPREDFIQRKKAMPLIAKYVSIEASKHGKRNCHNLYTCYIDYAHERDIELE